MRNENSTYAILNYQSEKGIDGNPSYNFWFTSSLIRVIGDKPFARGDVARLVECRKQNATEWNIFVEVLGDPKIDSEAMNLVKSRKEEIPTLLFVTTKIYLNQNSDVYIYGTENVEILLNCSSTMHENKSYTIAALITGKQGKIFGVDKVNGTALEWLITDNP